MRGRPAAAIARRFGIGQIMQKTISVKGAREHNLKNVDVDIPRDQLVVITGLSGSGKSSLAFDTIDRKSTRLNSSHT